MIRAYERALTSPDVDEQACEQIVPALIETYRIAGIVTRNTGLAKGALDLVQAGQKHMIDHFAGGSHWHILFAGTDLLL